MSNWLHRFLNPHCEFCREELREKQVNPVEEALKMENARMQEMIDKLFDKLLERPEPVIEEHKPASITKPAYVPWRVRQQMLENEDRAKARLLRDAPKPDSEISKDIKDLEVQLGVDDTKEEKVS